MSAASTVYDDGPEARRLRLQLFAARRLHNAYSTALEFALSELRRVNEQTAAELSDGRKPSVLAARSRANILKEVIAKLEFVLN